MHIITLSSCTIFSIALKPFQGLQAQIEGSCELISTTEACAESLTMSRTPDRFHA